MSCAGARKGSHRREICKGLGGHKVVCNLNFPYSKLGQVPASQASTLVMGQHLQEEKKEEEEKKKEKVDLSDEEVRLALANWPPEPEDVDPSQDAVENAPEKNAECVGFANPISARTCSHPPKASGNSAMQQP